MKPNADSPPARSPRSAGTISTGPATASPRAVKNARRLSRTSTTDPFSTITPAATAISDQANTAGRPVTPSPAQISGAKSARTLRRTVTNRYATTSRVSPTAYRRKKSRRSVPVIGARSPRAATSGLDGAGMRVSIQTKSSSGGTNTRPTANGIQYSGTPAASRYAPADLVTPSATMKLAHSPAARASVCRRPSRNPSTSPNTMPRGRPLQNSQTKLNGAGVTANSNRASSAAAMSASRRAARRFGRTSATTRMPTNLDRVYPSTWAVTRTVLYPMPASVTSANVPAVNGLRKAYMQK